MSAHLPALDSLLARTRRELAHASPETVAALRAQLVALVAARSALSAPPLEFPRFPTILRRMWSGAEVQEWLDAHLMPVWTAARNHARLMELLRALRTKHAVCGPPGDRACAHCDARDELDVLLGIQLAPAAHPETA